MQFRRLHSSPRTSPQPHRWAVAGAVAGLLGGVVAFAPASWLAHAVASASSQRVWLAQPQGSVWNGSAQLVLAGGQGSRDAIALPDRLHWRVGLRWGGLRLSVDMPCCASRSALLDIAPAWGGVRATVSQLSAQWPASLLTGLGTPWNTLRLDGTLRLDAQQLTATRTAGRWTLQGAARVDALDIGSRVSTLRPMGSYRLELAGGNTASVALHTLDGSLKLTGSGQWVGERLRFRGEASAEPGREDALANLLNLIGRRQGERSLISIG